MTRTNRERPAVRPADRPDLDYGTFFRRPEAVEEYARTYAAGSRSSDRLVWEVQRWRLRAIIRGFVADRPDATALDYACGDGRVLGQVAAEVGQVQGWDASPAMLDRCAAAVPGARLHHVDLAAADPDAAVLAERFDVITVFRLFLNLEPDRRRLVAQRLASLLRPGGLLIFDNHGNRRSLRHPVLVLSRRRHRFANEWSHAEVRAMLAGTGLAPVHRSGFGWLPEVLHRNRLSAGPARRAERFLLAHTRTPRLAIRVLYVARRPDPTPLGRRCGS